MLSYVEKNPWILHFDGSGCSGCGMEVQACFSPKFDVEQYVDYRDRRGRKS